MKLLKSLAGNEDALFSADAFKYLVGLFNEGETMAVCGYHGEGLCLDDQERAVEGVARLLVGDGEDGASDEGLEGRQRDAGDGERRKLWHLGIVGACHADDLGIRSAAADLNPVILKQLDGDVSVGQQLDVVIEFSGGNRAGAGLFYLDCGTGANGLIEVSRSDVEAVVLCLEEKVGQDRNGGLAFDNALCRREFLHQILAAYGNLHRCPLCGRYFYFGFDQRHTPTFSSKA